MKVSEITALLKKNGYIKLNAEDVLDNKIIMTPKTYFKYNGDIHINVDGKIGYCIIAKKNDIGLGYYQTSTVYENGSVDQIGTYFKELFFPNFIKTIENS